MLSEGGEEEPLAVWQKRWRVVADLGAERRHGRGNAAGSGDPPQNAQRMSDVLTRVENDAVSAPGPEARPLARRDDLWSSVTELESLQRKTGEECDQPAVRRPEEAFRAL